MARQNCEFGPGKKMCELRCSRAHQGQLFFAARACLCGRMTAPCARNFAAILCQKLAQKGGTPWLGPGRAPRAGKWLQKCSDGAPKSAFQTSAEAGKVMKYSIFSAHDTENLLEWGAAHAVRHGLRFSCVRGGVSSGICPPSVCLSVCHKNLTEKSGFLKPENRSFCSLAL